jgi:argininosuccinate lyase
MSNRMWGGRFGDGPDDIMEEINASIGFDQRLSGQDLRGSRAHCRMLIAQGIISEADGKAILSGLDKIETQIESGTFEFKRALEDIHMNIEDALRLDIGPSAGRLHTARSRNDQVATDFRLYVRDTIDHILTQLIKLQLSFARNNHAGVYAFTNRSACHLWAPFISLCGNAGAGSWSFC